MGLRGLLDFSFGKREKLPEKDAGKTGEGIYRVMEEESGGRYVVRCAENLFWLAMMVNEQGNTFAGKTILLSADIDLCGCPWIPIGKNLNTPFCGIFDGCGHCVSGIHTVSEEPYLGFFGVVMGMNKVMMVEISNLRLSEIRIESRGTKAYVGGVAGYALEGVRIEKCMVGGSMVSTYCCGGIVGYAEDCVSVRRCAVRGKVVGNEVMGALVGKLLVNSTLINCCNAVTDLYGCPQGQDVGVCDETSLRR